jgi:oxygen-independent coproporphyrinogen-3 oxidase
MAGHRLAVTTADRTMADSTTADSTMADPTTADSRRPPDALYLHVPFCVSLCPYCDFVVYAGAAARGPRNRAAAFVLALHAEIDLRADAIVAAGVPISPLQSVYLGGGTPSLLPADAVDALLRHVSDRFGIAAGAEVTIEANPGPDERGDAEAWRRAGITRLSFGAQSLDAAELQRLGRRHRPADVAAAVREARAAGFESVSLDLLYDVPGQTDVSWSATLEAALDLGPDHLSLYALTLDDPDAEGLTGPLGDHLPTTRGARRWRAGAAAEQDEDRAARQYRDAVRRLARDGWRGYEISNWARPGHESSHNLAYWERRPYEAAGPGAHAFDGSTRRWNAARLDAYVAALADGRLPPGGTESIDRATADTETAILALRLDTGLPADAARRPPLAETWDWAISAGLLERTEAGRIVLTTTGRLLSNELFARLLA